VLLFRYFAIFYDEQVYHPFLQQHRLDPQHDIWELAAHLNSIYVVTEDVCILCSQLVPITEGAQLSVQTTRSRLKEFPLVWKGVRTLEAWSNRVEKRTSHEEELARLGASLIERATETEDLKAFASKLHHGTAVKDFGASTGLKRSPATRRPSGHVQRQGLRKREHTL